MTGKTRILILKKKPFINALQESNKLFSALTFNHQGASLGAFNPH